MFALRLNRIASRLLARTFSSSGDAALEKTALYNLHVELGGKMVPFAGYSLPVQYPAGVLKSHLHTRADNGASLFDVGHMGQIRWHGKDRAKFLERILVTDVQELKKGEAKLSLLTNPAGGIIDDCVITNHGDYIYMVVNGATKYGDMKHFDHELQAFRASGGDVSYEYLHTQNLVALQGPAAKLVLSRLVNKADADKVTTMSFMSGGPLSVAGENCIVTRCGYTGEDGYEISMRPEAAEKLARAMLGHSEVLPAGLGARDSLRLEAGLCLYGHDINDKTTPGEAALAWTIGKRRKAEGGFIGSDIILRQIKEKSFKQKRVGFKVTGGIAREGAKLFASADASQPIGVVTSGTFSPSLKEAVGMAYVATPHSELGSKIFVELRGAYLPVTISKMPFVPHRYYK